MHADHDESWDAEAVTLPNGLVGGPAAAVEDQGSPLEIEYVILDDEEEVAAFFAFLFD
jgi:hypothetical protein